MDMSVTSIKVYPFPCPFANNLFIINNSPMFYFFQKKKNYPTIYKTIQLHMNFLSEGFSIFRAIFRFFNLGKLGYNDRSIMGKGA